MAQQQAAAAEAEKKRRYEEEMAPWRLKHAAFNQEYIALCNERNKRRQGLPSMAEIQAMQRKHGVI